MSIGNKCVGFGASVNHRPASLQTKVEQESTNPGIELGNHLQSDPSERNYFEEFLGLLGSVRLGVVLLVLLVVLSFTGMLIMQQNVDGFERYYQNLGATTQYLFRKLSLFNIYHSWYFNALLLLISLNIILASIERFPKTWRIATKPNPTVPLRWLLSKEHRVIRKTETDDAVLESKITDSLKRNGFANPQTNRKGNAVYIFAERGRWNRLGAYAVHVALLTIFTGGFLTAWFGFSGNIPVSPGQSFGAMNEMFFSLDQMQQSERRLPFEIHCTDISQKLVRNDGPITSSNTIDWITEFDIKDEYGIRHAKVSLNQPFDYRGYRIFQASSVPLGKARKISLTATSVDGTSTKIEIDRNGSAELGDGTTVRLADFRGAFDLGKEVQGNDSASYKNPGAILQVMPKNGKTETAYALANTADDPLGNRYIAGYRFALDGFEKVGSQHVLSIQRDPGALIVYIGFALLAISLTAVFAFSHKRIWVTYQTETADCEIVFGGDSNRNKASLSASIDAIARDFDMEAAG
ncbi:MAG: cytochrome c biogenesis protein ResB [Pyrinomonadaceae bacterium]